MEIDIDDVPWKDELTTAQPEIVDGYMTVPTGPGWGADINEEVARAHPWNGPNIRGYDSPAYAEETPPGLLYGLPSY